MNITKKMLETEAFVDAYISQYGMAPTYRKVSEHFKLNSPSGAYIRLRRYRTKMIDMSGTKGKSGGFREGAKRPEKYGEPTKVMRVPLSLIPALEKKMQKLAAKAKR